MFDWDSLTDDNLGLALLETMGWAKWDEVWKSPSFGPNHTAYLLYPKEVLSIDHVNMINKLRDIIWQNYLEPSGWTNYGFRYDNGTFSAWAWWEVKEPSYTVDKVFKRVGSTGKTVEEALTRTFGKALTMNLA